MEAGLACGSMVRFRSFWKKMALRATFFPKRMVGSALPEAKFPFGFVTA